MNSPLFTAIIALIQATYAVIVALKDEFATSKTLPKLLLFAAICGGSLSVTAEDIPPPNPTPVLATYYAPDSRIVPAVISLANSATTNINLAANVFTDTSFSGALAMAATRGVTVNCVVDISHGTTAVREYQTLAAAGANIWFANFPNTIGNHVLTMDGGTTGTGNYYWSPTAVQAGHWFAVIGGTATASDFNTTFAGLASGGTMQSMMRVGKVGSPITRLRLRGAKPSPRHKLVGTPRAVTTTAPDQLWSTDVPLSYWLNQTDGDCVTAEECANISEQFGSVVTDAEVRQWAGRRGFLNGASLTEVMDDMQAAKKAGLIGPSGQEYYDGPYSSVDWTNESATRSAIASIASNQNGKPSQVKIAIAADQLDGTFQNNSRFAIGYHTDQNIDHCVGICGYGTAAQFAIAMKIDLPPKVNPSIKGYELFSWSQFEFIDESSLAAICGEAWLRQPSSFAARVTATRQASKTSHSH